MATINLKCSHCGADMNHTIDSEYGENYDGGTYDCSRVPTNIVNKLTPDYVLLSCPTCGTSYKVKESVTTYKRIHLVEATNND